MHHLHTKYTEMKRTLKACSLILLKCICTSHYNKSTRVPSFAFSNIQMIKDLSEKNRTKNSIYRCKTSCKVPRSVQWDKCPG